MPSKRQRRNNSTYLLDPDIGTIVKANTQPFTIRILFVMIDLKITQPWLHLQFQFDLATVVISLPLERSIDIESKYLENVIKNEWKLSQPLLD